MPNIISPKLTYVIRPRTIKKKEIYNKLGRGKKMENNIYATAGSSSKSPDKAPKMDMLQSFRSLN